MLAIATRDSAIGVTVTGLMIGGAAYFWQEILGFFAGLTRKLGDEAATLEKSEHLRWVARSRQARDPRVTRAGTRRGYASWRRRGPTS